MKHLRTYNESLRDKMTSKSDEEVKKIAKTLIQKEGKIGKISDYPYSNKEIFEFERVAHALDMKMEDLYFITSNDPSIDNMFERFDDDDNDKISIECEEGEWYCNLTYKTAWWLDKKGGLNDNFIWLFDEEIYEENFK